MTISLGGITLNQDMVWREQFSALSVRQTVRETLGAAPVVAAFPVGKGIPITLLATDVNGRLIGILKKSVVDSILALAAVPGGINTLTYKGTNYSVIFRHEDAPAVDMVPLIAKTSYGANDLMRGEIKLLTV